LSRVGNKQFCKIFCTILRYIPKGKKFGGHLTERAIWIAHGVVRYTCPTLGVESRRLALDKQDLVRVA